MNIDCVKDLEEVQKTQRLDKMNFEIEQLAKQYYNEIEMNQKEKKKILKEKMRLKKNQLHMKRMSKSAQIHKLEKMEKIQEKIDIDVFKNKKSLFSKNNLTYLEDNDCEDTIDHIYQEILENE